MKLLKVLLISFAAAAVPAGTATAAYMPVGVQVNVPMSQVQAWGWTPCFTDENHAVPLDQIYAQCQGKYMMLADLSSTAGTFAILAAAAREDVLFDVGPGYSASHAANGAQWYFNENWSWGFTELGNPVARASCDINLDGRNGFTTTGLCWHTMDYALVNGWGYNNGEGFNDASRMILVADTLDNASLPEPGALGLVGLGLAGLAGARRLKRTSA